MSPATPTPRRPRPPCRLVGAVLATLVAMLLASCGGGGSTSGAERTDDPAADSDVGDGGSTEQDDVSPLTEYVGDPPSKADLEAIERMQTKVVVDCMREQGSDYVPAEVKESEKPFGGLSPAAYAEKWGFGYSTVIDADGDPVPDAVAGDAYGTPIGGPSPESRAKMRPAELRAFTTALIGQEEPDPNSPEVAGCAGKGYNESETQQELGRLLEEVFPKINDDPRMREVEADYAACMEEAGFPGMVDVNEAYTVMTKRYEDLVGHDPYEGGFEAEPMDAGKLAQLQQDERAIAVAHARCRPVYDSGLAMVSAEYEEDIIARNQPLMEKLRKETEEQRRQLEAFKAGERDA